MNRFLFCLLSAFIALASASCILRREAPEPEALLALVNGNAIHEDSLKFRLSLEKLKYDDKTFRKSSRFDQLKEETLKRMIENRAIIDWGSKKGITLTVEEQARGQGELKKGYTEREFELMLAERQIPLARWRDMAVENLTVDKILRETLYQKQGITSAEAREYYDSNPKEFNVDEEVQVRHIFTDERAKAEKLREALQKGENFAKLAILHSLSPDRSEGGLLNFFSHGTYPKAFDDACFKLRPGELSPVVQSPYGYHLFKLIERRPKRTVPFAEARPAIEAELLKKKMAQTYRAWLDGILSQSQVQVYRENLKKLKAF